MQIIKKAAALILATLLAASALAGCSRTEEPSQPSSSAAESSAQPSSQASSQGNAAPVDYSQGLTEEGYFEGVTALDYVTLPDYKTMEIPVDVSTISDEDVEAELSSLLNAAATNKQVTDRAVQDGDTVNIDYVGSIDGVEFEGGSTGGNGTTVTIGVTSYIDDFLEQLIGHKPGDTFDVNVTFPDPYPNNQDLANKDAVFVTTINYIQETVTPELTDQFAEENWGQSDGWHTAEEVREGLRAELRSKAVAQYLWQELLDKSEVSEVPQSLYDYQVLTLEGYYTALAQQSSMELEDYLSQSAGVEDLDALIEANKETLNSNAETSLIIQALSEDLGVKPSDQDVSDYILNATGASDITPFVERYGQPYLCLLTRESMAQQQLAALRDTD